MIGHSTVMGTLYYFGIPRISQSPWRVTDDTFAFDNEYIYQEQLYGSEGRPLGVEECSAGAEEGHTDHFQGQQWAYIKLDEPLTARKKTILLGSKLDADLNTSSCRIGLHGRLVSTTAPILEKLKVFKFKRREGVIERLEEDRKTAICKGLFGKNSDLAYFIGMEVRTLDGISGTLTSTFGQNGKCKVVFSQTIHGDRKGDQVLLIYRKFVLNKNKR